MGVAKLKEQMANPMRLGAFGIYTAHWENDDTSIFDFLLDQPTIRIFSIVGSLLVVYFQTHQLLDQPSNTIQMTNPTDVQGS